MGLDPRQAVSLIAVEMMEAVPVFEKYGIDYYNGGERSLAEACSAAGAPLEQVESELKSAEPIPADWLSREPDWDRESMASLIHYLIHAHHSKTRRLLDDIGRELAGLLDSRRDPPKWIIVRELYLKVDREIRDHMLEEEKVIFPYLIYAERALKRGEKAGSLDQKGGGFIRSMRDILFEHRFMDRGFTQMEKLVYLFQQDDGVKPLADSLMELMRDNQKHIQLENNVLLKRAALRGLMD